MSIAYIDWGGTHFRCKVESGDGYYFEKDSAAIDIVSELEQIFLKFPDIQKVGISFAGQVRDNKILSAPNIAVGELDLNTIFPDKKIFVQNDLKCAALSEYAAAKIDNLLVVYVGTGIGAAFIEGGRLVCGGSNIAGEIGHIPYKKRDYLCGCGKDNCLELTASGSALKRLAKERGIISHSLSDMRLSKEGAGLAEEFLDALSHGIATVVTLLNPSLVVLGGGIVLSNPWILEELQKKISSLAFGKSLLECRFRISTLKNGSLEGAKELLKLV